MVTRKNSQIKNYAPDGVKKFIWLVNLIKEVINMIVSIELWKLVAASVCVIVGVTIAVGSMFTEADKKNRKG